MEPTDNSTESTVSNNDLSEEEKEGLKLREEYARLGGTWIKGPPTLTNKEYKEVIKKLKKEKTEQKPAEVEPVENKHKEKYISNPAAIVNYKHGIDSNDVCIVLDTETNGLLKNGNIPRMVQLAYLIVLPCGRIIKDKNFYIYPDGFDPKPNAKIPHNIDMEKARRLGKKCRGVLNELLFDIEQYSVTWIVAHNVEFDLQIIKHECNKHEKDFSRIESLREFCTMKKSTDILKIHSDTYRKKIENYKKRNDMRYRESKNGLNRLISDMHFKGVAYKWPSLEEMYYRYIDNPIRDIKFHDAHIDAKVCAACFVKIINGEKPKY